MRVRVDVYPCSSLIRLIVLALGTGELDTTSSFLPFFVDLASLRGVDAFLLLERLAGSASFLLLFVNSALIKPEGAFLPNSAGWSIYKRVEGAPVANAGAEAVRDWATRLG